MLSIIGHSLLADDSSDEEADGNAHGSARASASTGQSSREKALAYLAMKADEVGGPYHGDTTPRKNLSRRGGGREVRVDQDALMQMIGQQLSGRSAEG